MKTTRSCGHSAIHFLTGQHRSVDDPMLWYEGSGTTDKRYLHKDERSNITAITGTTGNLIHIKAF